MSNALERFKSTLNNTRNSVEGVQQDIKFDIIQFIHEKLSENKMKKSTFASILDMKESQLSRILNAEANLTIESIARIYWAFKCRPKIVERIEKQNKTWAAAPLEVADFIIASTDENNWNALTIEVKG